jgi:hypothetical protein
MPDTIGASLSGANTVDACTTWAKGTNENKGAELQERLTRSYKPYCDSE